MRLNKRDFALLGLVIYFTFIGGTFYSQLNLFLRLANQVIVSVILGVWLVGRLKKGASLPRTFLDGAIGFYLAANLVSAALGQSPRFSLEGLWFSLVHILAFYLLVDLMQRGWTAKLVWAFYMASAVVCLVGLTEFLAWYFGAGLFPSFAQGWPEIGGWQQPIPPHIYRLAITLNGSTPLSAYLALLIPPAIGLILTLPPKDQNRQALWLWLALAFTVQILTFSRAGVLALAVSLSLILLGWLKISGKQWPSLRAAWRKLSLPYRSLIVLGGLIIAAAGLFWLQSSFAGRLGSTQFRFVLWQTALTIFQDHFLTGAGPGNFGRALLRLNQADLPRLQIASAHNVYLNTAAELGLIGLLAGGYLLFRLGQAWWRRWRQLPAEQSAERIRLVSCGAALVGLAAQTLVDTYSATPIILVVLALTAYIVRDLKVDQPVAFEGRQMVYSRFMLALLLIYAAGFGWLAWADLRAQSSFKAEQAANLVEAVSQAEQARALDPSLALRTFRLAFAEARLASQTNDPDWTQRAIEHYQAGLRQEPIWGLNSANLAGLLWQQDRRAEAIETLQRTVTAEKSPLYLVNLGYFYEQEGNWAEASTAYGQALALAPELAGSGFWQATPERAEKWSAFVEEAVKQRPTSAKALRINLALAREEFEAVEVLVGSITPSTERQLRAALAEVYLSRGQPEQASAVLEPLAPSEAGDYVRWGRVKLQLGDEAAAEKWLKTAVFLGDSQAHYYLGQLFEQRGDLKAAEAAYQRGFSPHYISENIEITIYGRSGGNDLIPQLLRIGVSPARAAPWLALGRLYEDQQRFEEAKRVYEFLLIEDPFLAVGRERLALLEAKQ
jgi:tetratricopeptide (TPR) repeat protein